MADPSPALEFWGDYHSAPHLAARTPFIRAWYEAGYYTRRSLPEDIRRAAEEAPGTKLVFGSADHPAETTAGEVYADALCCAAGLTGLGLRPGDAMVIQVPHWREGSVAFIGGMLAGLVAIPVVHSYGPAELDFILRQSRARLLVIPDRWRNIDFTARVAALGKLPHLARIVVLGHEPVPGPVTHWDELMRGAAKVNGAAGVRGSPGGFSPHAPDPDRVCMINFTSGTTSAPKGVMHSHNSLRAVVDRYPLIDDAGPFIHTYPSGHIASVAAILRPFTSREPTIYMDQWDGAIALDLLRRHRPTRMAGVPFHFRMFLDSADRASMASLKYMVSGGAGVPPKLMLDADAAGFPAARAYGSTEHTCLTRFEPDTPLRLRAYTDGAPQPGDTVKLLDDADLPVPTGQPGELLTMGPALFHGYLDPALNAAAFTADGFYRTGDIATMNAEGYLTIIDRKKDIIIRGGENISSQEVEGVLGRHPAVLEAAAVACPDDVYGERVGVIARLHPGANLTLQEVQAHFASEGVARVKTPERLMLVNTELPRNAMGKILKAQLRPLFARDNPDVQTR